MKLLFLIIFFALSAHLLFPQDSFKIEWEIEDLAWPWCGIVDNGGNTVIVGTIKKINSNYDRDAFIFKMSPEGEYTFDRVPAGIDTSMQYFSLLQLPNGNYFVTGSKKLTDHSLRKPSEMMVSIYDQTLNLVDCKKYHVDTANYQGLTGRILLEDDGNIIMAAAALVRDDDIFSDLGLLRFNQQGDTLETAFRHYERSLIIEDFNKIPGSENYLILESNTQWGGTFECYILKPDLTADTITCGSSCGDAVVGSETSSDYWYPDKTFLMSSRLDFFQQTEKGLGIFRVDTLSNISDYLYLNQEGMDESSAFIASMAFTDVGSIYIAGYQEDLGYCPNPDSIVLYVVDTGMNQVAYKGLGGDHSYTPLGVLAAKDGGAIVYGKTYYPENDCSNNLFVYYISRDELGLPPVRVMNAEPCFNNPKAYPNPATDIINIKVQADLLIRESRIRIYNSNGKKVYDYKLPSQGNTLQLNVKNLDSGLYVYEVTSNKSIISKGKFLKQK